MKAKTAEGLINWFAVSLGTLLVSAILISLALCATHGIANWSERKALEYEQYMELQEGQP